MTNDNLTADVDVVDVDVADVDVAVESDATRPERPGRPRPPLTRPWRWVSAGAVAVALAGAAFGIVRYRDLAHNLASLRDSESDRAAAAKLADDYALRSLTYSFEDPDAFFRAVESGVSQSLKDKYVNAAELLKGIMVQAQVRSTGEVLATDATEAPGQVYHVAVAAAQTIRNQQYPKSRVSLILLQVTVNRVGDGWQVSDIGPNAGTQASHADQLSPPGSDPDPIPAPAPPR